jgi:Integrase core domain
MMSDRLPRFIDEVYNPKPNVAAVMAALDSWFEDYNVHRPHTALAGQPPISGLIMNNLLDHDS